ncbi:flagellar hook-length control protein FliK [Paenibacillus darwinianus]|nr:flagellar hook-length control protein FliK [Paenibacillus darwinianus]EXX92310.1 hypothetical protein BG52_14075 [Paenibacillus darwinianus]
MQMSIGQMNTTPAPQTGSTSSAPSGEEAKAFGGMLVQVIGEPGDAGAGKNAALGKAIAAGLMSGELAALLAGATGEGVETKLDQALRLLESETAAEAGPDEGALADILNELSALLLSVFGFTPLKTEAGPGPGSSSAGEGEGQAVNAGDSVRNQLIQTLSFLKTLLQENGQNAFGKDQLLVLNVQLERLRQLAADNAASKPQAAGNKAQPDTGSIGTVVAEQAAKSNLHLLRMGNQPLQPSLLKTVIAESEAVKAATAGSNEVVAEGSFDGLLSGLAEGARPVAEGAKMQAQQSVPVNRFFETMTGMIVKQFGLTKANGVTEAKLLLTPEHLGQVDVRISLQNGQLTAQFVAENAAAKDMLENQLAQLRSALQSQGLQVEKLEVSYGTQQSQMFQDGREREHGGQAFQQQRGNENGSSTDGGIADFEQELVESVVRNGLGYGRAINITA